MPESVSWRLVTIFFFERKRKKRKKTFWQNILTNTSTSKLKLHLNTVSVTVLFLETLIIPTSTPCYST